jgi:hypothetical protein
MASTYRWTDMISVVGQSNPRLTTDAHGAILCDLVHSCIWGRADWRIALAKVPPFYLIPLQQDYVAPYISMPTDFLGLRSGTLTFNGTEPPSTYPPLMVDRYLLLTYAQSRPTSISYESTTGGLRIYPRPPSGIGAMDYQIECSYKKNPTKVTAATLANSGPPFDDQYFHVYVEGLKYFAKPAAQQRPEELVNFIGLIDMMIAHEAVNLGEQNLSPRESLVSDSMGGWGWG